MSRKKKTSKTKPVDSLKHKGKRAVCFSILGAVHELGMSVMDVGLKLGLSQSAASRAVQRGRGIAEASGLNLEIAKNA